MTLHQVAPEHAQATQLVGGGDPFGHHLHVERVRQLDDGSHDGVVVAAGAQHAGDRAVELQHVGLARAQRGERRDAGAEAVERELHAEAAQRLHRAQVAGLAIVERVFVEVERELVRVELHLAHRGEHPLDERALGQLTSRDVDVHAEPAVHQARVEPRTRVEARLTDDPVADGHDGARLLGEVQELRGQQGAALGVVPPQQRFGTGDATAVGGDDRLVGEAQLAGGERTLELVGELLVMARLGAHRVGVQLAARPSAPLRLVHRDVGVAQQLDGGFLPADAFQVGRQADGDADADRQLDLDAVHHDATAERVADAFGEVERGVLVDVAVAQDHELVAADAGDHVGGSSGVRDAVCHLGEQCVADLVADGVVDVLQPVDVHEQDGDVAARAADAVERVGRGAQQQQAVGQPGERVVVGLAGELALQVLGGGDVASDATPVLDHAVGGAVQHQIDVERALEAVGAAEADFPRPHRAGGAGHDLARHLVADGLQQPAGGGVADEVELVDDTEQPAGRVVGVDRRTVAVEDDDGVVGGADHAQQAVEQQLMRDVFGVVECGAAVADDAPHRVVHRLRVEPHPGHPPFAVPHAELDAHLAVGLRGATPGELGVGPVAGMRVGPWRPADRRTGAALHERAECCIGRGDATFAVGLEQAHRQRWEQLDDVRHPY